MEARVEELAKKTGFEHVADLDAGKIVLLDDVRNMCAANQCHMYGKNWSCPLACGTLEECRRKVREYSTGILVQTVGELED